MQWVAGSMESCSSWITHVELPVHPLHCWVLCLLPPQRIRARKKTDPVRFELLYPIIEDEVERKDDNHSQSCTKGLLWLKRSVIQTP